MLFRLAKEQKRLAALVIVMIAGIVFVLYNQFMVNSKRKAPVTKRQSNQTKTEEMTEDKSYDILESTLKEILQEKGQGRDPFQLPPGTKLKITAQGKSPKDIKPHTKKITAILITDSQKIASINHKVVAVGDLINGERVLDIKPDRVILERDGRKHIIMLEKDIIHLKRNESEE
jgi:hypothetical protein